MLFSLAQQISLLAPHCAPQVEYGRGTNPAYDCIVPGNRDPDADFGVIWSRRDVINTVGHCVFQVSQTLAL
jgi:hypothetical protein